MEMLKWSNKSAREILEALEIKEPPFDPFYIASAMGVDVEVSYDWDKIDTDGQVFLGSDGKPKIWINPNFPITRQNFTLAHELGHLVYEVLPNIKDFKDPIKDSSLTFFRKNGITSPKERAANRFAANLLLPEEHIISLVKRLAKLDGTTIQIIIDAVSSVFSVSKEAVVVRFKTLEALSQDYQYPYTNFDKPAPTD